MTREEQLAFCKKCTKRKMDLQQGLLCSLTDQKADFEGECKDFDKDESVKEQVNYEELSVHEAIPGLSDEKILELKSHQDIVYALVGGLFVSVICAFIWAAITVATEYQIGYMAIAVGLAAGVGVRFFGAGVESIYGFIGAFYALLGCALGNLFSQVGFIAEYQQLSYWNTLMLMDLDLIVEVFIDSFSPMDLLFYGFAIVEGYKFAFRKLPENAQHLDDLTPEYAKLRLPLVIGAFVLLSISGYSLSRGVSGPQTYYYETGELLSKGEMVNGQEEGTWIYYYPNGKTQIQGDYKEGREEGTWLYYYEDGSLMKSVGYQHGLFHGLYRHYVPEGQMTDSVYFELGRKSGASLSFYENGQVASEGSYYRGKETGIWKFYHDNGKLSATGEFKEGSNEGLWKFYTYEGNISQEVIYDADGAKIMKDWDRDGRLMVEEGVGSVRYYHANGQLSEQGKIEKGKRSGIWKSYHANGQASVLGEYKDDLFVIESAWSEIGKLMVENGEGEYVSFYPESEFASEEGLISNGLRQGIWTTYFPNSGVMQSEIEYKEGLMDGAYTNYFESGGFMSQGIMVQGEQHGEWTWYFENGAIESTASFDHGKKIGEQVFYTENGDQAKKEVYEEGEFVSETLL
ncbi:toxin-antitoxin system YwqK family antitoxin [Reichenbachiella ulvae]|uniref:Toxin-antitoxin system YwqK family antitoxin n=1 Tax=Reichenbachiella ulvae TaxID=2980104 RepID=A0ABT3D0V1_9BACT|nr:toxin-antitoxin system YwqK family antitoxin [Reichenbachiella ulvae]MCV9389083.1 toxin-antitoxin system YwqK family antitoxin [Reichenbachiella ulvae]